MKKDSDIWQETVQPESQGDDPTTPGDNSIPEASATFSVPGVNCLSCIRRIQDRVRQLPGIGSVWVDLDQHRADIRFNPKIVQPEFIKIAIESAGYRVAEDDNENQVEKNGEAAVTGNAHPILSSVVVGLTVGAAVIVFYLGLITLTADWFYAKYQFEKYQWWIIALAMGLGFQAVLYSYLKGWIRGKSRNAARSGLAASSGMSTTAMAACCAHYLVPILGALGLPFLATAAATLERYQTTLFLVGVLSNAFGIALMFRILSKNGLISLNGVKARLGIGRH